ncbi:MAG TPA: RHS repeat-associated core domain-containing protein [Steroidobacteraceae bacterium]|nr:RHS repeat-associated core domain-containing protein [Steroidobacteraceae bacterium]
MDSFPAAPESAQTLNRYVNTTYDANGNMTNRNGTTLVWYANNLRKSITKNSQNSSVFQYTPSGERWRHVYKTANVTYTQVNLGGLLTKETQGTTVDWKHYVQAGGRTVALVSRKSTGVNTTSYLLRDHLGATDVITNSSGGVVVRESFDAFGKRRGTNWTGAPPAADLTTINGLTRRGYTDHEMLDSTDPIHMNGRVYDPLIARFVSADPFIDCAMNTQGWNRYTYVKNNPLSRTDPTGFKERGTIIPISPSPGLPTVTVTGSRISDPPAGARSYSGIDTNPGGGASGSNDGGGGGGTSSTENAPLEKVLVEDTRIGNTDPPRLVFVPVIFGGITGNLPSSAVDAVTNGYNDFRNCVERCNGKYSSVGTTVGGTVGGAVYGGLLAARFGPQAALTGALAGALGGGFAGAAVGAIGSPSAAQSVVVGAAGGTIRTAFAGASVGGGFVGGVAGGAVTGLGGGSVVAASVGAIAGTAAGGSLGGAALLGAASGGGAAAAAGLGAKAAADSLVNTLCEHSCSH